MHSDFLIHSNEIILFATQKRFIYCFAFGHNQTGTFKIKHIDFCIKIPFRSVKCFTYKYIAARKTHTHTEKKLSPNDA